MIDGYNSVINFINYLIVCVNIFKFFVVSMKTNTFYLNCY